MASNYPGSLDSFDTIASDKKTSDAVGGRTHRQMHNDLGDAIEAVQTELGTNPSGSHDTVKDRLEAIEAGSGEITIGTVTTGDADVTITGNPTDGYELDFTLPAVGDDTIGTAALIDDSVTSRKILADKYPLSVLPVIPPQMATTTIDLTKDNTQFMPFVATADAVVTGMTMVSGGTAVTGSPTSIRFGLYHIMPGKTGPMGADLLARTASDTGIFASTNTEYTRSWDTTGGYPSEVRLVAGQHYAVAYEILGGTMGKVVAPAAHSQYVVAWGSTPFRTATAVNPPPDGFYGFLAASSAPSAYYAGFYASLVVSHSSTLARPLRTVTIGDSIAGSAGAWIPMANGAAGSPLLLYYNGAVGGTYVTDATASVSTAVVPNEPDVVIVHSGANDIAQGGTSSATMQARYTALFDALDAAGVGTIVACTPPPSTYITAAGQESVLASVRSWLLGLSRPNLIVADTGIAMSTGDGVTSDAAKRADGVHPNATGYAAMAAAFDDVLAAL